MTGPVYALNLFNVADRDEYLAYSRRSSQEVQAHGGRVVALGKFRETVAGDIKPRTVMILVESTATATIQTLPTCTRTARRAPVITSGSFSTNSKTCGRFSNNGGPDHRNKPLRRWSEPGQCLNGSKAVFRRCPLIPTEYRTSQQV